MCFATVIISDILNELYNIREIGGTQRVYDNTISGQIRQQRARLFKQKQQQQPQVLNKQNVDMYKTRRTHPVWTHQQTLVRLKGEAANCKTAACRDRVARQIRYTTARIQQMKQNVPQNVINPQIFQ